MSSGHRESAKGHFWVAALFFATVPICAHWLFSWIGFNPSDEGLVLAFSRRILQGEVPHRDFITYRPAASAVLHLVVVLIGGEQTFWLSRGAVWLELGAIAWLWVALIGEHAAPALSLWDRFLLATLVFALSSNRFPVLAWYSVDGLFLITVGVVLVQRTSAVAKWVGYFLIGLSCLCKQTYAPMLPLALLLMGDWRRVRYWAAVASPVVAYVLWMAATGGVEDLLIQLRSQSSSSGLWAVGIRSYALRNFALLGFLGGFVAAVLARAGIGAGPLVRRPGLQLALGSLLLYSAGFAIALTMAAGEYQFTFDSAFAIFGALTGFLIALFLERWRATGPVCLGMLILGMAWSSSISVGYNTPALVAGPMFVALLVWADSGRTRQQGARGWRESALLSLLLVVTLACYYKGRRDHVYRDRPASELTYSLDGVFPGARNIRTSRQTEEFLRDLQSAVGRARGIPYAIVPDLAAYWVSAAQPNPLPVAWTQKGELNHPLLVRRVEDAIATRRGHLVVIVQKVDAGSLAEGLRPASSDPPSMVPFVRTTMTKFDETQFFDLYR